MSRLERILESNREYAEQWWSTHFEEIKEGKYPECRKIIEKWTQGTVSCKYAVRSDEYHGWKCSVSEGACMFLVPDSKRCAEEYGEGPDVEVNEWKEKKIKRQQDRLRKQEYSEGSGIGG